MWGANSLQYPLRSLLAGSWVPGSSSSRGKLTDFREMSTLTLLIGGISPTRPQWGSFTCYKAWYTGAKEVYGTRQSLESNKFSGMCLYTQC
jgi:hypothetical protein